MSSDSELEEFYDAEEATPKRYGLSKSEKKSLNICVQ